MNIERHLQKIAFSSDFGRQMRFIAGPRQAGKTTMAKLFLQSQAGSAGSLYYNWDNRKIRDTYLKNNHFFATDIYNVPPGEDGKRWLCMDEIHKYPGWKNILKDFFDSYEEKVKFIITGSARLDMMRQSGDSLSGRYFNFRLNPVSLLEFSGANFTAPSADASDMFRAKLDSPRYLQEELLALLEFSGFPEPLGSGTKRFQRRWKSAYFDTLIKEDLRELTEVKNIEKTAQLMQILPPRVASPLSINALAEDLNVSYATAANYLYALELGYLIFRISPYHKKIARSLKKGKKAYFYDWTRAGNPASRFENHIAVELKSRINLWEDAGYGIFELNYIRNRDGRETDFLIVRDQNPWLLVEVKLSRTAIDYHHKKNRKALGNIPFVQIVLENNIAELDPEGNCQMSASRFFA
ncbi:MAG: AAA family ATPase [Pseudomonadota bacterium]|nr:AAA family ATPase [Pseudomonadota bacterium]